MAQQPDKRLDLTLPVVLTPYLLAGSKGELLYMIKLAELRIAVQLQKQPESEQLP